MELRVGDTVRWRDGWGREPEQLAVVDRITVGGKYSSRTVDHVPWRDVHWTWSGRWVLVDLRYPEGSVVEKWAYGFQIAPEGEQT